MWSLELSAHSSSCQGCPCTVRWGYRGSPSLVAAWVSTKQGRLRAYLAGPLSVLGMPEGRIPSSCYRTSFQTNWYQEDKCLWSNLKTLWSSSKVNHSRPPNAWGISQRCNMQYFPCVSKQTCLCSKKYQIKKFWNQSITWDFREEELCVPVRQNKVFFRSDRKELKLHRLWVSHIHEFWRHTLLSEPRPHSLLNWEFPEQIKVDLRNSERKKGTHLQLYSWNRH